MLILYLSKINKISKISYMIKSLRFFSFLFTLIFLSEAFATTSPANYISANTYNNLYPYMNNKMKTTLNPGTTPSQSNAQINVLTRTRNASNTTTRNVVPRTTARVATTNNTSSRNTAATVASTTNSTNSARSATTNTATRTTNANNNSSRGVVARTGTSTISVKAPATRSIRTDYSTNTSRTSSGITTYETNVTSLPSSRCMADYVECMDSYCEREDTAYNRCYCSTKLAQIDAQYQPEIDRLIKEILTLKGNNNWTEEEMNEYWMETVGKYTGENSWTNLENALNIDWAGTESRVRGQQSFAMGHSYCSQHLKGCAYMATNMRDAYRSEIARDCSTYETALQKIKNTAESLVEAYK